MSTTMTRQMLKKEVAAHIKSIDPTQREIVFVATHRQIDRTGEVVEPDGVSLATYRKNPTLLEHHDPKRPVGRVVSLTLQTIDGVPGLLGLATFPEHVEDSEKAYRKVKAGLLSAVSIGFLSLEQSGPVLKGQTGITHTKTELLEVSLTSLPACPSCLILEKSMPPVQDRKHDDDLITFDVEDLKEAIAETLKREVDRTVKTRLTGLVD